MKLRCIIGLHKYETVRRFQCKARHNTFMNGTIIIDAVTLFKQCKDCGDEITVITDGISENRVDKDYVLAKIK